MLVAGILLMLSVVPGEAVSPRCQISDVSYAYPHQALPSEQIEADTLVSGTCVTTGLDYYLVRVDLVDGTSGSFESSNSTPIGYSAINFTVKVENFALTPSANESWLLQACVYVDRAGGTGGFYMHDYTTVGNLWIQVGQIPVEEFHVDLGPIAIIALAATTLIISRERRTRASRLKPR